MEDSGFESQHNTYMKKKSPRKRNHSTSKSKNWRGCLLLTQLRCCHFMGTYSLARCEDSPRLLFDVTYYSQVPVRKAQMLGDHSCIG